MRRMDGGGVALVAGRWRQAGVLKRQGCVRYSDSYRGQEMKREVWKGRTRDQCDRRPKVF